ncbi:hypothetical protein A6E15_11895 [Natrinema saccharevitans]|uniref:Uncharacterized protein n=1 Tax=Natrinema saccharevitans TaxID=301967 RepID=A0A1S8AYL6_9EURY|nr:hypothetical protein [Natrinema saccharevitans]OLZ41641.1 hypothetical protein A6E15_11895 [Natrinema saccharevitans]
MDSLSMRDHVRPTDGDYPGGIYRVVGTGDDTVTLLRVGDADGRRVNTGEVVTVDEDDLATFEPADNPDENRPLGPTVASGLEMIYWRFRAFGQQLAAHPIPATVAGALVAVGYVGDSVGPLSESVASVVLFVGAIGLAFVGSGSLDR